MERLVRTPVQFVAGQADQTVVDVAAHHRDQLPPGAQPRRAPGRGRVRVRRAAEHLAPPRSTSRTSTSPTASTTRSATSRCRPASTSSSRRNRDAFVQRYGDAGINLADGQFDQEPEQLQRPHRAARRGQPAHPRLHLLRHLAPHHRRRRPDAGGDRPELSRLKPLTPPPAGARAPPSTARRAAPTGPTRSAPSPTSSTSRPTPATPPSIRSPSPSASPSPVSTCRTWSCVRRRRRPLHGLRDACHHRRRAHLDAGQPVGRNLAAERPLHPPPRRVWQRHPRRAGNLINADATEDWFFDNAGPTVTIQAVTPDPRNASVTSVLISFSEPVNGFNLADLTLTRNGGGNLLTPASDAHAPGRRTQLPIGQHRGAHHARRRLRADAKSSRLRDHRQPSEPDRRRRHRDMDQRHHSAARSRPGGFTRSAQHRRRHPDDPV